MANFRQEMRRFRDVLVRRAVAQHHIAKDASAHCPSFAGTKLVFHNLQLTSPEEGRHDSTRVLVGIFVKALAIIYRVALRGGEKIDFFVANSTHPVTLNPYKTYTRITKN